MDFRGSEDDFFKHIDQGLVLVDFYAIWCGPCQMLAPVLEELATKKPDLVIVKVNVDENPALAQKYQIQGVPNLLLFKDGKLLDQITGFRPTDALLDWIDKVCKDISP